MDPRFEEVQKSYIAELRAIMPQLEQWWEARNIENELKGHPLGSQINFDLRWPAGLAGHPRILAIFRKYFLEIETINSTFYSRPEAVDVPQDERMWGVDPGPEALPIVLPVDLLIEDLEDDAPDLFEVMSGLVFVPIGDDD